MRILITSSTYAPAMNGQAVFTTNLAEGLVRRGHTVVVAVDSRYAQASQTFNNGVRLEELKSFSWEIFHSRVFISPFPGQEIRHLLDTFQPDIVHIQDHFPTCRAAAREARRRGIKIIGSNHFIPENLSPYIPILPLIKPVFNWVLWQGMLEVYRHVDVISAQSAAAARLIRQQGLKMPILPISCGIDLQRFYPDHQVDRRMYRLRYGIDPSKKAFFFLGRIDGEKRIDLILRAARQLERQDIQLVIAGQGRAEGRIRKMAVDIGVNHKVRFTGFIPEEDLQNLMNSIDVFVMPSEAELLSISTLEAMACGRPVLLANALALPELVRDGENGYLFKPGDVGDLVRLINHMADQPDRWEAMGLVSREIALSHSLKATIDQFDKLYAQLALQQNASEVKLGARTHAE